MGTLSAPFNVGGAEHKRVGGAEHEHVGGSEQIAGAEHVGGAEHFDAAAASSGRLKRQFWYLAKPDGTPVEQGEGAFRRILNGVRKCSRWAG